MSRRDAQSSPCDRSGRSACHLKAEMQGLAATPRQTDCHCLMHLAQGTDMPCTPALPVSTIPETGAGPNIHLCLTRPRSRAYGCLRSPRPIDASIPLASKHLQHAHLRLMTRSAVGRLATSSSPPPSHRSTSRAPRRIDGRRSKMYGEWLVGERVPGHS
ncbi:hypothetical protein C8R46DRAFT_290007 [Mycena filopes]|nr:hypothetical protein C8R46DRAFT_290007 [Mycena filopes]